MKKKILLVLLFSISVSLFANDLEEPKVKNTQDFVYFTYGTPSVLGSFTYLFSEFFDFLKIYSQEEGTNPSFGCFQLGYQHMFNKIFGVGILFNYEKIYSVEWFSFLIRARVGYTWSHFGIYYSLALGLSLLNKSYSDRKSVEPMFGFDIFTVSAVFIVNKNFGFTVEAGGPYSGMVRAGCYINF